MVALALPGSRLTWQLRDEQRRMGARMTADLAKVWPVLDFRRLDETYPAWAASVDGVVRRYEVESVNGAGDYFTAISRERKVLNPVVYTAPQVSSDQVDALLHSQSVASLKKASMASVNARDAANAAFVATSQSMVRVVRDRGRDTVRDSALSNRGFGGWSRVGTGEACEFCRMLISRGAVYSEESVRFASHLHCNCEVEPARGGDAKPVSVYRQSDRVRAMSDEGREASRDRVAEWLANNLVG